jgi:choice-of-anchor A domain-containing protein
VKRRIVIGRLQFTSSAVAIVAGLGLLLYSAGAGADSLPGGLGPCGGTGSSCPTTFPLGSSTGTDANVNILVGGNLSMIDDATAAEGRTVVMGNVTIGSDFANSSYDIGITGGAGPIVPVADTDFLSVGGNITIQTGKTIYATGGKVVVAGSILGAGTISAASSIVGSVNAVTPYSTLPGLLTTASSCYAYTEGTTARAATGTAARDGDTWTFTGTNNASLEVFNVPSGTVLDDGSGGAGGIDFANIASTATVIVNLLGTSPHIDTYSGGNLPAYAAYNAVADRLIWNAPDATAVTIEGPADFQGTFLVGKAASTTTIKVPGFNGRFFTAGNLIHSSNTSPQGASVMKDYPFNGTGLPTCVVPTTPATTTTAPPPETSTTSGPTDTTPAPSETNDPGTTATPTPSLSAVAGSTTELAATGSADGRLAVVGIALVLAGGLMLLFVGRKRSR